ncbi:MAG: 50S ribosomal protein L18 [Oscillospiraceae bacterium]|jgi:large subunit ribosomal protein L18|nr:50S ribosomal protein L18 [Oscillospiraceae bacterium]
MLKKISSNATRLKRHGRVRAKVFGTTERPRLNIFRSINHIYGQIINDETGITLVSASSLDKSFKNPKSSNKKAAAEVGKMIAERATKKKIKSVVFDRGGYLFHGRVKEFAEGARGGGLKF